jgi:polysaccharide export outer membrane protein
MAHLTRFCGLLALGVLLAGCELPNEGPARSLIQSAYESEANTAGFILIDLNRQVADYLRVKPEPSFGDRFGKGTPVRAERIGVGDVLQVRIWEADAGGLFASSGTVDRGQIPDVVVATDGNILIPYAGSIRAAGRTPAQVAAAIVERLQSKTVEPQAHVSRLQNVSSVITVTGDVGNPGIFPLTLRGDSLLDAIAAAGGSRFASYETLVTLTRRGTSVTAYLEHVLNTPGDNIYLQPRDEIHVERRPRTYTAFGAVEKKGNNDFGASTVSVLEAVGKVSGLSDDRADPKGVFLLRFEPAATAYGLSGATAPAADQRQIVPVIYRIDLDDPNQYFFAQVIGLRDKDVIYVANAPAVELNKFMTIVGKAVGAASATTSFATKVDKL